MKILHSNLIGDSDRHLFIIHGFLGMGDNWKSHAKKISENNYTVPVSYTHLTLPTSDLV